MLHHVLLALTAVVFLIYGAASKRLARGVVSAPMLCVAVGCLAGPLGAGLVEVPVESEIIAIVGELALAVVLFTDASGVSRRQLAAEWTLPARLLAVGLPLTVGAGLLVGWAMFPEVPPLWLAVMAAILAPTDAALGQAVVTSTAVPQRFRDTLNIESGLNDGLVLPLILALLAYAGGHGMLSWLGGGHWARATAIELGLGGVLGIAIGVIGGRLLDLAWRRGWVDDTFARLLSPGLAVLAISVASLSAVNGFVAAYVAGLTLAVREPELRDRLRGFGEADGAQFSLFVFLLFGLAMLPAAAPYWDLRAFLYAGLSLTVIRMLPVAISLLGTGLDRRTVAFVGWFGPRGIASVLYLAIVIDRFGVVGQERVVSIIVLTVLLSVLLHGATAAPFAAAYGRCGARQPSLPRSSAPQ